MPYMTAGDDVPRIDLVVDPGYAKHFIIDYTDTPESIPDEPGLFVGEIPISEVGSIQVLGDTVLVSFTAEGTRRVVGQSFRYIDEDGAPDSVVVFGGELKRWTGPAGTSASGATIQVSAPGPVDTIVYRAVPTPGPEGPEGPQGPEGPTGANIGEASIGFDEGEVAPGGAVAPAPLVFYVPDYETTPGQNTQAAIQAAFDAAYAAGPDVFKVVRLRAGGVYNLETVYEDQGGVVRYNCVFFGDNLRYERNNAIVFSPSTAPNLRVFFFNAAGRTGGTNSLGYLNWCTRNTQYRILPAAQYAPSITLNNSGDAANFSVGDWILIRAGQCIDAGYAGDDQPDGEPNQVVAKSGAVLTLRWPTAKPYRQEWRITSNTAGKPTTFAGDTGLNTLHPQVSNITNKMGVNVKMVGPGPIYAPDSTSIALWLHYYDFGASDLDCTYNGGMALGQFCRHGRFADIRGRRDRLATFGIAIAAGAATCDVDIIYERVRGEGNAQAFHLHEGASQIRLIDCALEMADTTEPAGAGLSVVARAYDVVMEGGRIIGGNSEPSITIGADCDGGIVRNVETRTKGPTAVRGGGPNWLFDGVTTAGGSVLVHPDSTWRPKGPQPTAKSAVMPAGYRRLVREWGAEFTGLAGCYFSTPDAAANSITGDLDVAIKLSAGSVGRPVTTSNLIGKYGATGQFSWVLQLQSTGAVLLTWSANGSSGFKARSSNTGLLDAVLATDLWVRAMLDVDNGAGSHSLQFQTSLDGITWTNFGSAGAASGGGTTSIFDSTSPFTFGGGDTATPLPVRGAGVLAVDLRSSLSGSIAQTWRRPTPTATTWVSSTGETWTGVGPIGTVGSSDLRVTPPRHTTAGRPSAADEGAGAIIYDATLGHPIWSNGTVWKDFYTGATV